MLTTLCYAAELIKELKTLDSLGKGIQQHKSAEATLRGLDRLTDTGAFLAKQQKDLMKVRSVTSLSSSSYFTA